MSFTDTSLGPFWHHSCPGGMRRGKQSLSSLLTHCSDASTTGGRFSKVDLVILDGGVSFVLCDIVTVLFTLPRAMYYKGVVILTSRIAVFAVVIYAVVSISFPEYPSCCFIAADALYFVFPAWHGLASLGGSADNTWKLESP